MGDGLLDVFERDGDDRVGLPGRGPALLEPGDGGQGLDDGDGHQLDRGGPAERPADAIDPAVDGRPHQAVGDHPLADGAEGQGAELAGRSPAVEGPERPEGGLEVAQLLGGRAVGAR